VQQIISILRHYWIASAITAVVLIALSFVVIKMLPKSYVATETLIFNYENKDVLAGREFPVGQLVRTIPTQIELIFEPGRSRTRRRASQADQRPGVCPWIPGRAGCAQRGGHQQPARYSDGAAG